MVTPFVKTEIKARPLVTGKDAPVEISMRNLAINNSGTTARSDINLVIRKHNIFWINGPANNESPP